MMHPVPRGSAVETRFLAYVVIDSECWTWVGHKSQGGYGCFGAGGQGNVTQAHRYAYERWVGPIPGGLEIDHLCRVRACVNPDHLEAVTHVENVHRSLRARFPGWVPPSWLNGRKRGPAKYDRAIECQKHHLKVDHWRVEPSGRGVCRPCEAVRDRRKRAKRNRKYGTITP